MGFCMVLRLGVAAIVVAVTVSAFAADAQKPKKVKKGRTKQVATQPLPPVPSGPFQYIPFRLRPRSSPTGELSGWQPYDPCAQFQSHGHIESSAGKHGATIDVPPSASEHVVTNLNPGPARDILAKLLNGSHYNYVMLGSVSDPNAVSKIVLTSKVTAGADGPSAQSAALQPPQQQVYQNMPQPNQVMPPPNPQPAAEGDGEEVEPEPEAEEGNDPAEQQDQEVQRSRLPARNPPYQHSRAQDSGTAVQELQRSNNCFNSNNNSSSKGNQANPLGRICQTIRLRIRDKKRN